MTTTEWNILKLLEWTTAYFTEHGVPSPRLDAELLLSDVLTLKRIDLYLNFEKPVAATDLAKFKGLIQRRVKREPLQYIQGHADFFGRRFTVTPDVLIPRPETEQLVARALEWLDVHPAATRVLDFGTGSGCIAITLAIERPALQVTALDISEAALSVARGNAERLGATRVILSAAKDLKADSSPSAQNDNPFDLIISNPPYIAESEIAGLQPEVSRFEPHLALSGGEDGLAFYRQLLQDGPTLLTKDGALAIEIGEGQGDAIAALAATMEKWKTPTRHNDLTETERILIFEKD